MATWITQARNASSFTQVSRNVASWTTSSKTLVDYQLLIGDGYRLSIGEYHLRIGGGGQTSWSNRTKN